jgi:tetratricopeptide (TPR) repeat protein
MVLSRLDKSDGPNGWAKKGNFTMSQSERFEPEFNRAGDSSADALLLPQTLQASGQKADFYLKQGNSLYNAYLTGSTPPNTLEKAIDHYKKALEIDPKLPEGYVKLASALWEKGDIPLDVAQEFCEKALKLNPAYGEANLFLGYFLRRSGKVDEALKQFQMAVQKTSFLSSKPRIALGVGLIHKAAMAEPTEKGVIERLQLTCQGLTHFGLGCLLLPTDQNSFQLFQSALVKDAQVYSVMWTGRTLETLGLNTMAQNFYQWATQKMPHEPMAYHLLADSEYKQQQVDQSLAHYEQALALSPNDTQLLLKLGKRYQEELELEKAAEMYARVHELEPHLFEAVYQLGRIHTDRKDHMRALYYFKSAFALEPQNPFIHSHMAYLMFKLEDFDGAIQEYRLAVSYGQDDEWTSTVAQTLGVMYYQVRKDMDAAIGMFQLSFQLNPKNLDSMAMLADLYFEQGDLDAAVETYQFIIQHEPENAECYSYLGYLLWQMDHNEEAIQAYQMSLKLDPKNPISLNNLGVIYLDDLGQVEKAADLFDKAYQLKPDYTLACFNLGRCLESRGQVVEAANHFSEALSLNRLSPELEEEEIQERLSGLFKL